MAGSPIPTKDPIIEGERNLLSRIWVRFFQDLIKDVGSYAAHASRHLTGGSDEVDGDKLDIDWTPTNYTPSTSPSEANSADNLTAHLKGMDTVLGTVSSHASAHITGGSDEVDGDKLDIDWTPSSYTPSTSPSEASNADNLTAHLKGIDTLVGTHASRHITGGADEIDADKADIDWTPTNYTPSTSPSEADNVDNLTAHLKGIDVAIATKASADHDAGHITGGSDEIDGDKLDIDWTPTNYTPSTSPSEADNVDNLAAHLKGIDTLTGTHTSRHITGGADEIDGDKLDIDWTPTNYTPSTSPSEANNADNLTAHLKGIDSLLESHTHDGDTLQLDGITSDGGAFSFSTTGDITLNHNLILPADGAIKVADSNPQIIFDNTNNWLEITGKVGIGVASPTAVLEVYGTATATVSSSTPIFAIDSNATNSIFFGTLSGSPYGTYMQSGDVGAGNTYPLLLNPNGGNVGIGITSPSAKLHIDQTSTTAAIPALYLDQADVSEEMIEFNTTIGTGNAIEAVGAKSLTTTHFIKVTIPGPATVYIPVGTIA